MRLINLIDNCGQLLNIIIKSSKSADRISETFFRDKRKIIGSKERKSISQIVFTTLRNLILIKDICITFELDKHLKNPNIFIKGKNYSVMILVQILIAEYFSADFDFISLDNIKYIENEKTLSIIDSISLDLSAISSINNNIINVSNYIDKELSKNVVEYYSNLKNYSNTLENDNNININKNYANYTIFLDIIENFYSFPKEFINELLINSDFFSKSQNIFRFVKAMNRPANTCIRINSSICSVNEVINALKEHKIESFKGKISPTCVIIPERRQLTTLNIYKKGFFTIQDEASQLVGFCINPKPEDSILDACAGAGGKTLHLADLQNDKGNITAHDIEITKLKEIPKRAKLTNYKSINIAPIKDKKFDIVLVDAPCSGTGTIRRDPTKKYNIFAKSLNKITKNQFDILTKYSKYVKTNGELIYSTCSIFPQENEFIVKQFLNENTNFQPEPILSALKKYKINIESIKNDDFYITLLPFIHNTDGFFIAKMKRIY